jgi:hypothetical protein
LTKLNSPNVEEKMHLSSKARNDSDNYKKNAEIKMLGVTEAKTSTLKENGYTSV